MRLLVLNDFGIQGGGTENRVRLLLHEFLRRGYVTSVDIVQLDKRPVPPPEKNITVFQSDGSFRRTYRVVRRIIGEKKIDLVQAHNMAGITPAGVPAAVKAGVPVVWFAHDYWPLCAKRSFVDPFTASSRQTCRSAHYARCCGCVGLRTVLRMEVFRFLMKGVSRAIASCVFVRDMYEAHHVLRRRWMVAAPWIATEVFAGGLPAERDHSIVFTGSLIDYKGAWVLANAAAQIKKSVSDARFLFIGAGAQEGDVYRRRIEDTFVRAGLKDSLRFYPHLPWQELAHIYRTAGVYVCPTVCMETFGLNWAEAMAAGVPVVASAIGSLPELLAGKGMLVPPRNHEELAGAVINVLKDKELSLRLSRDGMEYVRASFSVSQAAEAIFAEYRGLVNGRRQ